MKKALCALCLAAAPVMASAAESVQIVETASGRTVTVQEAAKALSSYDVVVFGEFHDSPALHDLEEALFTELYQLHGDKQALSLEMFERDTQSVLDGYLAGTVTEEDFLAASRPWPRYQTDYRPAVEFAKAHALPVIASNVPRPLAAILAKTGSLDTVPAEQKRWLPKKTYAPEGPYKEKFEAVMKGMASHGMPVDPNRIGWMYEAQCLKDDAMAESMATWLTAHPEGKLLHMQGEFHGNGRLGSVEKLQALLPELKIAVLAPIKAASSDATVTEKEKQEGDFLLFLSEN